MKAEGVVFLSLIVCFLVCACTGQKIITVEVGQDVILTCKDPNNNKTIVALEWIKPGLGQDFVFLYRDEKSHPENQHQSYQNRTDLQDKDMKDGNFSLVLKNVKMEDTGTYECQVYRSGKIEPINNITLKVLEPGNKDGNITDAENKDSGDKDAENKDGGDKDAIIGDAENKDGGNKDGFNMDRFTVGTVVGVIVLALLPVVVFLIYKYKYKRQNPNHSAPTDGAVHIPMSTLSGSAAEPTPPSVPLLDPAAEEKTAASPQSPSLDPPPSLSTTSFML